MVKKLICIGDSITKGTYTALGDSAPMSVAHPNFAEILQKKLGFGQLVNYGSNGISYSSLSPVLPESSLAKRCNDFECGDFILLAAGTNDYGTDVPLGNFSDTEDVSFYGAVDKVFRCLKSKNPGIPFFVVLPIPRLSPAENGKGYTLDDYRDALSKKAMRYSLHVIDGRGIGIDAADPQQRALYIPDGTHPNEAGHKLYADFLFAEIIKKLH